MADTRVLSPGVFTREKDLSFLPGEIQAIGAAVVGPTVRGPAFTPTTLSTYEEFERAFGSVFLSGSGTQEKQYKFLTNYAAQMYLKWAENLTVVRILNSGYLEGYSNVVTTGSYGAAITAGSGSDDFTSSLFTQDDAAFTLHLMSPGDYGNTGQEYSATNGIGSPADENSNGVLVSGSRESMRWEIADINEQRGTFDLYIRRGDDRTNRRVILEQYNDISLDPNDPNYIARVIGDQKQTLRYDGDGTPYLQLSGSNPNRSRYIRVEVHKQTLNYIDVDGTIRVPDFSASLPAAVSGTFSFGSDGFVQHPRKMYDDIVGENTQGFNLSDSATGASGSTAYFDAIDILSNQDEYDINMLLLPGVIDGIGEKHGEVYTKAINMVEARGDIFLVIDPTRYGDAIANAINAAVGRNTSYGAMYYPWVQISDADLGRYVWLPPSVAVAGVIAFNDYVEHPWYAPAGLNRGGIDRATQAERKIVRADRDALYRNNVNPIATFPREGMVIYGQKTLQKKRSALDRVNVRRLLIAAKKFIASASQYLLFEQNTQETRVKFLGIVEPFLEDIRRNQGLYDFKVIMDESNNTPDVIDRNELRGAIYLKPTRTVEYIILDFYVMPTGAVFPGDGPTEQD